MTRPKCDKKNDVPKGDECESNADELAIQTIRNLLHLNPYADWYEKKLLSHPLDAERLKTCESRWKYRSSKWLKEAYDNNYHWACQHDSDYYFHSELCRISSEILGNRKLRKRKTGS